MARQAYIPSCHWSLGLWGFLTYSSSHVNRVASSQSQHRKKKGEKPSSPLLLSNQNAILSRKVSIPLRMCRLLADLSSSGSMRRVSVYDVWRFMWGFHVGPERRYWHRGTHIRGFRSTGRRGLQASLVRTSRWMEEICCVPKNGHNLHQMPVGSSPTRDWWRAA